MEPTPTDDTSAPDRTLMDRVGVGDRAALSGLRRRYETTLYAEAYRLTFDPLDSDYVVESVFAEIWRLVKWWPRDAVDNVRRWLLEQTRALARALMRTNGLRNTVAAPLDTPPQPPDPGQAPPS